jgi:hypothetical protein
MTKDDVTPYDLACFMALQGVIALGKAKYSAELAQDAICCVDALFEQLAEQPQSGQYKGAKGPWKKGN